MIRMVVFDMDGVLCRYQIERRLTRLNGEPACPTLHGTWGRL